MKKSRIYRIFLLCYVAILVLVMVGCGANQRTNADYANQNQFLQDMAKGIEARLKESDTDTSAMSQEEMMKHYAELVACELDKIGKYIDLTFENEDFNDLAHMYVSACMIQKKATESYKDSDLYDALWNGGRTIRAGVIVALYEKYDLPITAEQADSYRTTTEVTVTVSGDSTFDELFGTSREDISLHAGDLKLIDSQITFVKDTYDSTNDRYDYSFTVLNNSSYALESITLDCVITDMEGNILGTDILGIHNTVETGKSAKLSSSVYLSKYSLPFKIVPDKFNYDGNGDHHVYGLDVEESDVTQYTFKVTDTQHTYSNIYEPYNGAEHMCEECSKEGQYQYDSFTGQSEYYCAEHYLELMEMLEALGID